MNSGYQALFSDFFERLGTRLVIVIVIVCGDCLPFLSHSSFVLSLLTLLLLSSLSFALSSYHPPSSFCHFSLPPSSTFTQVIEWATHHKDDPPPPEDDENKEKRTDDIEPWDQEFLKVDQGTLFELILVGAVVASVIEYITCM